jgi:hypothetical protein
MAPRHMHTTAPPSHPYAHAHTHVSTSLISSFKPHECMLPFSPSSSLDILLHIHSTCRHASATHRQIIIDQPLSPSSCSWMGSCPFHAWMPPFLSYPILPCPVLSCRVWCGAVVHCIHLPCTCTQAGHASIPSQFGYGHVKPPPRKSCAHTHTLTHTRTDRQTGRQTDRHTDRQDRLDRQTDRQTHRQTHRHTHHTHPPISMHTKPFAHMHACTQTCDTHHIHASGVLRTGQRGRAWTVQRVLNHMESHTHTHTHIHTHTHTHTHTHVNANVYTPHCLCTLSHKSQVVSFNDGLGNNG